MASNNRLHQYVARGSIGPQSNRVIRQTQQTPYVATRHTWAAGAPLTKPMATYWRNHTVTCGCQTVSSKMFFRRCTCLSLANLTFVALSLLNLALLRARGLLIVDSDNYFWIANFS